MGEPVLTMSRSDDASGALRRMTKRRRSPWRHGPNALLDQCPPCLDRIEIVRVGRQEPERRTDRFDQLADLPGFVGRQIVHHHDIAATQVPDQMTTDPLNESLSIHGAPLRRQREPFVRADGPDIVRLSPQFIGRASTRTSPRGSHACERPIDRFAPDSSRKTSRRGSI
jgi:hypothetical protein